MTSRGSSASRGSSEPQIRRGRESVSIWRRFRWSPLLRQLSQAEPRTDGASKTGISNSALSAPLSWNIRRRDESADGHLIEDHCWSPSYVRITSGSSHRSGLKNGDLELRFIGSTFLEDTPGSVEDQRGDGRRRGAPKRADLRPSGGGHSGPATSSPACRPSTRTTRDMRSIAEQDSCASPRKTTNLADLTRGIVTEVAPERDEEPSRGDSVSSA